MLNTSVAGEYKANTHCMPFHTSRTAIIKPKGEMGLEANRGELKLLHTAVGCDLARLRWGADFLGSSDHTPTHNLTELTAATL